MLTSVEVPKEVNPECEGLLVEGVSRRREVGCIHRLLQAPRRRYWATLIAERLAWCYSTRLLREWVWANRAVCCRTLPRKRLPVSADPCGVA
jgi:hypothetical protein